MPYRLNPFTAEFDIVDPGEGIEGPGPGEGSSTDNAVVRWDGTDGTMIQNSGTILDDNDELTIVTGSAAGIAFGDGDTKIFENADDDLRIHTANTLAVTIDASQVVTLANPLAVGSGGTGSISLTDGGILLGNGTNPVTVTAQPTNGQLLIGSTGVDPILDTLTAGTGISIANGPGSITISGTSAVPLLFTEDVGTATPAGNNLNILGGTGVDTVGAGDTVTINAAASVPLVFTTESGSAVPVANNLNIFGGEGIDCSAAGDTITVAGEDASDSNKGIATFALADFDVVAGDVSLEDTVVKTVASDSGSATPSTHGFTIAGGTGISTSGAVGTITITATSPGITSWVVVTAATQAMAVNTGYICSRATDVTLTLPDTAPIGSEIRITDDGSGGNIIIAQNAAESIKLVGVSTTVGVGGSLTADEISDSIHIVATTANTTWTVLSMTGNWTIV